MGITSSTSFAEETSSKMKIFSFQTLMVLAPFLLCIQGAPNQRIVGGVETTANEFPFLVSLQRGSDDSFTHLCGGTIYNSKFIITAAHCVFFNDIITIVGMRVVAGAHNLSEQTDSWQISTIKEVHVQSAFSLVTGQNDVALLELDTPLTLNSNVAAVSISTEDIPLFQSANAIGYGATWLLGLSYSEIPRKSTVTVTPDFLCTVVYGAISAATYNIVQYSSNQLCAGSLFGGSGVCRGDAGGPLLTDSVPPKMIGIISWGLECAATPLPQIYTRASAYTSFFLNTAGAQ